MKHIAAVGSLLILGATSMAAPPAFGNVAGAIYTSLSDGTEVNFNIYASKADVYLNGGPGKGAGSNAPGLVPDGVYVFMVTTPSGDLLSTDKAECRQVQVTGGLIVGFAEAANLAGCAHLNGTQQPGGAMAVQLLPYNDTSNPGGEYKAWLTPVGSYVCSLSEVTCSEGKNGFISSESKTDNFKVGSVADEIDTRFYDASGNILDNRMITWRDTHGASNTKWSYFDPARIIMHEAHVEAPEVGTHYISIADQPGCTVGEVVVDGSKTRKKGPQTVPVKVTKGMKSKGPFTIFIDVTCTSTK
jgi:hypothetical protein